MAKSQRFLRLVILTTILSMLALSRCPTAASYNVARGGISVRVSPTYITSQVSDGDLIGPIYVSNAGSLPLDLQGFIYEGGHDENGIPVFSKPIKGEDTLTRGVSLTLEPAEFTLMPGESRPIKVKAHVTPTFSGGAYPIIVFQGQPLRNTQPREPSTSARVAVLTLLTVEPNTKQDSVSTSASIESVVLSQDPVDKSVTISAICKNEGNIHTNLRGTAVIKSYLGHVASVTTLEPVVCLPGYKRAITARFAPFDLDQGIYIAELFVNAEGTEQLSIPVAFQVAENGMITTIDMDLALL